MVARRKGCEPVKSTWLKECVLIIANWSPLSGANRKTFAHFETTGFDPNRLGQQYRRTKVRPVCKRRAVGLGASTNGTNTFVLMDAPC